MFVDCLPRHYHFHHVQGQILFPTQKLDYLIDGPSNWVSFNGNMESAPVAQYIP